MISYVYVLNTYGEPCSTSSLYGCTGYTGKYYTWFLLSVLVFYYLWMGVQLPQGEYISYGRSYLLMSIWCGIGYSMTRPDDRHLYYHCIVQHMVQCIEAINACNAEPPGPGNTVI